MFVAETTFDGVLNTYIFDRKLRLLIFDEIERIEISLRTKLIYEYSLEFGNNWYETKSLFRGKDSYFYKLQELLMSEMNKTSEVFIRYYRNKYTFPANPSAWMALELTSFGQLSMLFKNLKSNQARKRVAAHYGLDDLSVSVCQVVIRDRCCSTLSGLRVKKCDLIYPWVSPMVIDGLILSGSGQAHRVID